MKSYPAFRRGFLLLIPAITAVLLAWHGSDPDTALDLRGATGRWLIVHVGLLVMIPLIAIVLWMLLDGIGGRAATVSRVMLVPFAALYAAFESMMGIGTGVLVVETDALPATVRGGAEALTERWWEVPMPTPVIATAAILSWVVAVGAAVVAHVRARSPLPVVGGLAAAMIFFALGHPGITGVLGMAGLLGAAAFVAFGRGGDGDGGRSEAGAHDGMSETPRPIMMAIDEDPDSLALVRAELEKRYAADYDVVCDSSPRAALDVLREISNRQQPVALVLADFRLQELSGPDVLGRAAGMHPTAKRVLTVTPWEDRTRLVERMVEIMAQGQIDYFVIKPTEAAREYFHRAITEFLDEWTREQSIGLEAVRMVGEEGSPSTRELRDLLQRNNVPCTFLSADSQQARDLLDRLGLSAERLPVLVLFDGTVLVDPSLEDIAASLGARAKLEHDLYDVVIVGAGPAGLGAAVYAASEGLRTLVVEREAMGGQAGTTSLIRNYLGFPRGVSGSDLALRAYEQAAMFGTEFDFAREVVGLREESGDKVITLSDGTHIRTRAVILAAGVSYRRLGIPSVEALLGRGVFYGATVVEAKAMQGREVFVIGAGNSAGQAVVHLAKYAARVTLLVRGDSLTKSMSEYLIMQIDATPNIEVALRTEVVDADGEGRLGALVLRDAKGGRETVTADALFVFIGASPRTDWMPDDILRDDHGFVLTGNDLLDEGKPPSGWRLERPPLMLEASIPGVFAAGDARHGSVKRVASAVGEGAAALQACHTYLEDR